MRVGNASSTIKSGQYGLHVALLCVFVPVSEPYWSNRLWSRAVVIMIGSEKVKCLPEGATAMNRLYPLRLICDARFEVAKGQFMTSILIDSVSYFSHHLTMQPFKRNGVWMVESNFKLQLQVWMLTYTVTLLHARMKTRSLVITRQDLRLESNSSFIAAIYFF